MKIDHEKSSTIPKVMISFGAATITPTFNTDFLELISAADQKLYLAKN
ncbi:MAG TPA: diguanylate cyclase [Desulfosporosinus sp.]|nr:diguanylate cyclase [Desulfosporosinus sp.]